MRRVLGHAHVGPAVDESSDGATSFGESMAGRFVHLGDMAGHKRRTMMRRVLGHAHVGPAVDERSDDATSFGESDARSVVHSATWPAASAAAMMQRAAAKPLFVHLGDMAGCKRRSDDATSFGESVARSVRSPRRHGRPQAPQR